MKSDIKKALYENIMTSVAKEVKKALNESTSQSQKALKLARQIIDTIKRDKNIGNSKTYNIKFGKSILCITYNKNTNNLSACYDNEKSFKNNKTGYITINGVLDKNIEDLSDTLTHEITHYLDLLNGQDKNNINNTYTPGLDEGLYDGFLYRISPTEQHAFYAGFANNVKKDKVIQNFRNIFNQSGCKTVEEFVSTLCNKMVEKRHKFMKDNNLKDETKLPNNLRGLVENPIRILEYNYYILKDSDSFKNFIKLDPITNTARNEEELKYIKNHLAVFNNGNADDLDKIYTNIMKVYKNTFNNYITLLKSVLKINESEQNRIKDNMKKDNKKLYESIMASVAKEVKKALNEKWEPTCETELGQLMETLERYTTSLRFDINLDRPTPLNGNPNPNAGSNVESFEEFFNRLQGDLDEYAWNSLKKYFIDGFLVWQKEQKDRVLKLNKKLNAIETLTNKLGNILNKQGLYK